MDSELKKQFEDERLDPVLKVLIYLANGHSEQTFGKALWITSLFREGDKGVHGYWRGADLDNGGSTHGQLREVCNYINEIFIYDLERPDMVCAMFHTVDPKGKKGWHIHLQVFPNTRLR